MGREDCSDRGCGSADVVIQEEYQHDNIVQTGDDIHEYDLSKSAAIYYDGDKTLKFVIKGTNKIDANAIYGIVGGGKGGLEFSGNGKLTISNASYHIAIDVDCGLTINGEKVTDARLNITEEMFADGDLIMKKGKKKIIRIVLGE